MEPLLPIHTTPTDFSIRGPRDEDVPAVTALVAAYDAALHGAPDVSEEDIRDDWKYPGLDLARDVWLLEAPDGALTGYARHWLPGAGRPARVDLFVHPAGARSEGVLALLSRAESRARELRTERARQRVPEAEVEQGAEPGAALGVVCPRADSEMRRVLEGVGYTAIRAFLRMDIDLSAGVPPPAAIQRVEIRPFRLGTDDRAMHATIEGAFAEHFEFFPRPFDVWWTLRAQHAKFDPTLWLIAWEGTHAAGALTAYDFTDLGFVREVGVLQPYRGRGIAAALLLRSFEEFLRRGQNRVFLGVDAENHTGAIGLYQRLGMRVTQRHDLLRKPLG